MIVIECFVIVQFWTLTVEEGLRINITFLDFELDADLCKWDWVELSSENYNSRHCGLTTKPWSIITDTNFITIRFFSNNVYTFPGFLATWSATTASPTYPPSNGCDSCTFPFVFGETTYDTCISEQDLDTQPWCSSGPLSPPTEEGTHILPFPKISCSDNDSSCPSSPPQMLITSPDYPQSYPDNANQVILINRNYRFDIIHLYLCRLGPLMLMMERK